MAEGEHINTVNFDAAAPEIVGNPSYELQSQLPLVDAFVLTGHEGYIAAYNTFSSNTPTPNRNACPSLDVNSGLAPGDRGRRQWDALGGVADGVVHGCLSCAVAPPAR